MSTVRAVLHCPISSCRNSHLEANRDAWASLMSDVSYATVSRSRAPWPAVSPDVPTPSTWSIPMNFVSPALLVPAAAPAKTFADLLTLIDDDATLTDRDRRDSRSAVTRLCEILNVKAADLCVDPGPLRALLKRLHPKQAAMKHDRRRNVTVQTIRNIRWHVRRVLERYENELRRHRLPLSPSWENLLALLPVAQ